MIPKRLLLTLLLVFNNNTLADISDIYIGAIGGALLTKDLTANKNNLTSDIAEGSKINYKPGYKLGLFFGLSLPLIRIELELSKMKSELKPIINPNTSTTLTGSNTNHIIMANTILVLPSIIISPYAGGGLGYVHINNTFSKNKHDNVFGYQLIAGLSFNLSIFSLFIDYRYIDTSHTDTLKKSYSNHTINAGFYIQIA